MATLKNTLIDDTGYLQLPSGTTAQRPSSPSAGYMRWNTTESYVEVYDGANWIHWGVTGNNYITDGLVLYVDAKDTTSYPGSGNTWYDLSGNNLNFTMVGTVSHDSSEGYFYGWSTSNYWQCNASWSSYLPTGDSPRTICALVRRTTGVTYEHVIHYGNDTVGQAYGLTVHTGLNQVSDHRWGTSNFGSTTLSTDTNYFLSTRYHTTDYPGARYQVNSTYDTQSDITSNLSTGTSTLRIGSRISTPTEVWNGRIHAVMVYDRVLTDEELGTNFTYLGSRLGLT